MAARARYSILMANGVELAAGSKARLLQMVQAEADQWKDLLAGKEIQLWNLGTLRADYGNVAERVRKELTEGEPSVLDLQNTNFRMYPPFGSPEGRRIRSLWSEGAHDLAFCAMQYWWTINNWDDRGRGAIFKALEDVLRAGKQELVSARVQESLEPFAAASKGLQDATKRIEAAAADTETELARLSAAVQGAVETKDRLVARLQRREAASRRLAHREMGKRRVEYDALVKGWDEDFQRQKDTYVQQLQYRAPVELWTKAAAVHKANSRTAFTSAMITAFATLVASLLATVKGGPAIAASFTRTVCSGEKCEQVFSAQGPLLVGALLLCGSLAIWLLRFLSKIYLSERHLALAAAEKKAFTEAYLALVHDKVVSGEQEAIVLSALFRPTSDGVIRDDDGAFDISAAAIIAKAMSGSKPG